jgi:hypothetical protein
VQLLVLVSAAVFAWYQLREARDLREEQGRPFVVIDIEGGRPTLFDLVVKNTGRTIARDVRFVFDPPLESSMDHVTVDGLKMFRDGISTLAPGKEIRTLFDSGPSRYEAKLPDVYAVSVTYSGRRGKPYHERVDLDFGLYWNRMYVTVRDLHDVHKELSGIHQEMRKWTGAFGGLLSVTPEDVRQRYNDIENELEGPEEGPASE